jgi:hypothetical protein
LYAIGRKKRPKSAIFADRPKCLCGHGLPGGTGYQPVVRVPTYWPKANQEERSDLDIQIATLWLLSLRDVAAYRDHGLVARATGKGG